MMELNRNHFFVIGTILVLLGIQFRFIESFTLNEESSRFIADRLNWKNQNSLTQRPFPTLMSVMTPPSVRRTVQPPRWLGWSFISVGVVLILHSLTMRRPE